MSQQSKPARVLAAIGAALLFASGSALALDPSRALHQAIHDAYGKRAGLPQQAVYSIAQTPEGYLWFATEEGLARFDGLKMTVFTVGKFPELGASDVRTLLADPAGGLWIGTARHLVHYDGSRFVDLTPRIASTDISVRALAMAPDNAIWVVSDVGIHRVGSDKTTTFTAKDGLPDGPASAWVGTMAGLARIENGRIRVFTSRDALPHDNVFALRMGANGDVWVGTMKGLAVARGGAIVRPAVAERLGPITVRSLAIDPEGSLWVGSVTGIFRLTANRIESLTSKSGLTDDTVLSILNDREGSLWLGTMFGGVNRLRDPSLVVLDRADGLSAENVACIMEARDGTIWIGYVDAGLDHLANGRIQDYGARTGVVRHYGKADGLPSEQIRALEEAPDGTIWVGTTAGPTKLAGRRFVDVGPADGRPREPISAIAVAPDGSVWMGSTSGTRRLKDGRWIKYTSADGVPTQPAWTIRVATNGAVWIGTDGGGLARYDGTKFDRFTSVPGVAGQVLDIYEDRGGVLWFATDHGLTRFKEGGFKTVDQSHGLPSDSPFRLLEDDDGYLWMSANIGVARISKLELNAVMDTGAPRVNALLLGSDAGAKEAECNGAVQPAGWRMRDGRLWFSTSVGPAVIDPHRLHRNTMAPPVVLSEVLVGERAQTFGAALIVPAGETDVRVKFASLTGISPERVQFKWKLEGRDAEWHSTSTREVSLGDLKPREYVFRVTAANADGVWNDVGAQLRIIKQPFFHETWWFTALCVVLAGTAIVGFVYWRLQQHARREVELTRRIDEAVAQIKRLHGMIPICAWCKKVRSDAGSWQQVEVYVRDHSDATFSHGICPECQQKLETELEPPSHPPKGPSKEYRH